MNRHWIGWPTLHPPSLTAQTALAFLVVIPEGDLLLFQVFAFIFHVFSPKIACQVQKQPNSLSINDIQLAF
jgi:hypothetical protein